MVKKRIWLLFATVISFSLHADVMDVVANMSLANEIHWVEAKFPAGLPFVYERGESPKSIRWSRIRFKSGKTIGLVWTSRYEPFDIYLMQDGRYLMVEQEESSYERVYRIDAAKESVSCSTAGTWADVPDTTLWIRSALKTHREPSSTVLDVDTTQGRLDVQGREDRGTPFLGSTYLGRLDCAGSLVRDKDDEDFTECLRRAKSEGLGDKWELEYKKFYRLFKDVFYGNRKGLVKLLSNSHDWRIVDEKEHRTAYRTFHSGKDSCVVRLNMTGRKPGCLLAAKGRCQDPNAGYYAAAHVLISMIEGLAR